MSRPERALTRVWWACGGKQAATPEPKGKLDTMNGTPGAVAPAPVPVNGPEDGFPEWDQVDWGQAEKNVRRLRRRIFAASRAGDLKKVRSLQKLMVRHEALVFPDGGGRPRSLRRRSGGDEAGGSLNRGSPGRAGAASTKLRRFSTAGWAGRGERDGKVYERNRLRYAS